ncbi:MAG: polysaccharide biosynthesis tyrosine autokinase [Gammaproteobacteria bacterium]|nr:polysaccharide biosynthesis tyrosine autokinase [Gammaproteobacteria bacterium]
MSQWPERRRSDIGGGEVRHLSERRRKTDAVDDNYLARQLVLESYQEEPQVNLRDYWQILRRRQSIILLFAGLVLFTTLIASMLMTPIYRASLLLQIDRESPKVLNYQDVTPVESINDKDFYQTQYELLRSYTLVKRVINELDLIHHPVLLKETEPSSLRAVMGEMLLWFAEEQENRLSEDNRWLEYFLNRLTVEPVKNSRLVRVHFDSTDPETATMIVNNYAENYINMNLERRYDASSYAKSFLDERLASVKIRLEESEQRLVAFARQNQIINIDDKQNIDTEKLRETNLALARAEQARISSEAIFNEMRKAEDDHLSEILDSEVIQTLKNNKAKLEAEYEDKRRVFKPAYPAMLQLAGQIEIIEKKIHLEIASVRAALEAKYNAARDKENMLRENLAEIKESVLALQDRSIQYNILKREVDTNRELYEGLLQRMKEVGVAGGISTNNISVVDPAAIPDKKHKPRLLINMLLALFVGFLGGVGLAFLFEHLDDSIKMPEDFERLVQLPVIGLIPFHESKGRDDVDVALMCYTDPSSAVAEAYRSMRTALNFSTTNGAPQVMLVTSPSPGEGKSTTALSTAITFNQTGKKVLLVDTDLRNPSLHKMLNLSNADGLSNFLTGNSKPIDVSHATNIDNLFVITSGPVCPNPAELLSGTRMQELLVYAREAFDCIVLDGPPVLGLADALLLSNMADGTLIVAESGVTRQDSLKSSVKRLRNARAHLIGGLVTKVSEHMVGYGQYAGYYYYERSDGQDQPRLPV